LNAEYCKAAKVKEYYKGRERDIHSINIKHVGEWDGGWW
jgi:hypothetical protein